MSWQHGEYSWPINITLYTFHVFYTQKLPQKLNHTPAAVHNTFQFSNVPGKRHRFREAGIWLANPPSYYHYKFLTYTHKVLETELNVEGHFRMMNHQLKQIRTALSLAIALDRVLVMPKIICNLDRTWFPSFPDGRFPGSDDLFTLPFHCPLDHVLDLEGMEKNGLLNSIREDSFLPNGAKHTVTWGVGAFRHGVTASDLRAKEPHHFVPNLHFESVDEYGGFDDPSERDEFYGKLKNSIGIWCCDHASPGHIHYDFMWDMPHTDKFGRHFDAWEIRHGP